MNKSRIMLHTFIFNRYSNMHIEIQFLFRFFFRYLFVLHWFVKRQKKLTKFVINMTRLSSSFVQKKQLYEFKKWIYNFHIMLSNETSIWILYDSSICDFVNEKKFSVRNLWNDERNLVLMKKNCFNMIILTIWNIDRSTIVIII